MWPEGTFGISPSFLELSHSSGQVTHVLLTRSRLCPRPKPGSSLHLHVLGTPPAFVLSQDQTLREELPQRVVRNTTRAVVAANGYGWRRVKSRVRPWRESDPCAHRHRRSSRRRGAQRTQWAQGARRGQSWHRRPSD